jgi:hypothetical protein
VLRIFFRLLAGVLRIALSILGGGAIVRGMSEKTYTARQLAERYGVARSTARGWLNRRLIPGARLEETDLGDSYWLVPESALKNFIPPKPGPVPKAQAVTSPRRSRKKAEAKP